MVESVGRFVNSRTASSSHADHPPLTSRVPPRAAACGLEKRGDVAQGSSEGRRPLIISSFA